MVETLRQKLTDWERSKVGDFWASEVGPKVGRGLVYASFLGATLLGNGCAYNTLPESAKNIVRNTPGILWPIHWREPAKKDALRKRGVKVNRNYEKRNNDWSLFAYNKYVDLNNDGIAQDNDFLEKEK